MVNTMPVSNQAAAGLTGAANNNFNNVTAVDTVQNTNPADIPNQKLIFSKTLDGPSQNEFLPGETVYIRVKGFGPNTKISFLYYYALAPGQWAGAWQEVPTPWTYSAGEGLWRYKISGIKADYKFGGLYRSTANYIDGI